jgi:hypothetical protein
MMLRKWFVPAGSCGAAPGSELGRGHRSLGGHGALGGMLHPAHSAVRLSSTAATVHGDMLPLQYRTCAHILASGCSSRPCSKCIDCCVLSDVHVCKTIGCDLS